MAKRKKLIRKLSKKLFGGKFKNFRIPDKTKQTILNKRFETIYDLDKVISEEHTERIITNAGVVERYGDFKYRDGGVVPVGEYYHIHYSRIGKSEIYMTGKSHNETSLVIDRVRGATTFGQYTNLKPDVKPLPYLNEHIFKITNKQRKIGLARRYFAKEINQNPFVFEIKKSDFRKPTSVYNKIELKWTLSLDKELMEKKNIEQINMAISKGFDSLEFSLNPIEGYLGDEVVTKEDVVERLDKLSSVEIKDSSKKKIRKKKRKIKKSANTLATTTTTQTAPPSGGGSGGGAY